MDKKNILIVSSVVLVLAAIVCSLSVFGPERSRNERKVLVSKRKLIKNGESTGVKKQRPKTTKVKIVEDERKREKPVLLVKDEEESFSPEIKKLLIELQDALDREDRKGVSKLAAKIQEMIAKGGQNAVPVAVRMKAVEAISWFLPDSLADLVAFMGDSDPDVIDDVMTAFEDALDNVSLGDRELSQIVKSFSKALSNDDALDALFFCVESDMRNSIAVDTYKYLLKNGSKECKARVLESIEDFTGEDYVKTEVDLDNWLKENPDDEDDEDFYAGEKDEE